MPKDPTDLPGIIETATLVSQQTDRWMFVAMLIIFIVAVVWLTKYFTEQLEKAKAEFKAVSTEFNAHLKEVNREFGQIIAKNTEALEQVMKKL